MDYAADAADPFRKMKNLERVAPHADELDATVIDTWLDVHGGDYLALNGELEHRGFLERWMDRTYG